MSVRQVMSGNACNVGKASMSVMSARQVML